MHTCRHRSFRLFDQPAFHAPHIRDDRARLQTGRPLFQMPIVRIHRRREHHQIGVFHAVFRIHDVAIDGAEIDRRFEILDAPPHPDDPVGQPFPTKDHAERAADQPHPDNRHLCKMHGHALQIRLRARLLRHTSRPTAIAIFRKSCISSLNLVGLMDSSPSHNAHSGFK